MNTDDDQQTGPEAGGEKAGGTEAGGEKAGGTEAGGEKAGGTEAGGEKAGGTEAGGEKAGGTEAGGEKAGGTEAGGTEDDGTEDDDDQQNGDTFPRPYVERLRARSAGYRARAKDAEGRAGELERALFTERVRALDVLADPADLPFDADMLDDPDALRAAVDALVAKRPHYRRRGTTTPGATGSRDRRAEQDGVSLTGLMRGHS